MIAWQKATAPAEVTGYNTSPGSASPTPRVDGFAEPKCRMLAQKFPGNSNPSSHSLVLNPTGWKSRWQAIRYHGTGGVTTR
jgi:hypothetical protein